MENAPDMSRELLEELAFSEEELEALKRAQALPITFDDDCPETTPERALLFKRVNPLMRTAN